MIKSYSTKSFGIGLLTYRGITIIPSYHPALADGRVWKVDGRAQALVSPGLATPLLSIHFYEFEHSKGATKGLRVHKIHIGSMLYVYT